MPLHGLYWWTASACSGDVIQQGGAAYIAYSDPRLLAPTTPSFAPRTGSSGGFHAGDTFLPGISIQAAATRVSTGRGVLGADCGYGSHFVRDDEAFYYARNRGLYRKSLSASAFAVGEPISFFAGLERFPVAADGVLFVTDSDLWSFAADLPRNTLTIQRTWKMGTRDVTRIREVLTLPGVSLRKFAVVDIQAGDGSYYGSELILLSPNGNLYRAGVVGGTPQLLRTGVQDFAVRNESYFVAGNLGVPARRRATTLYLAVDNPLTPMGNGSLLGLDLNPGGRGEFVEYPAGPPFRVTSVAVDPLHIFLARTPGSDQANSELLRRRAPAEPTIANPGDPDFETLPVRREFRSLRSTGRLVYFAHGNTVQRLAVTAPAVNLDFEAFGLEVTQAIQNLDNTVPLVAGRRVFVRGYARLGANSTGLAGFDVPAQLRVAHAPKPPLGQAPFTEVAGSPLLPVQTPRLGLAQALASVRTNLAATYLFEVPEAMVTAGDLRFEFVLNPAYTVPESGANPLANNTAAATLETKVAVVAGLTMVPMRFGGEFYDPHAPGSAFWDIIARARTLLPFAQFRIGIRNPGVAKSVLGSPARSFDLPADEDGALALVDAARMLDGNPLGGPYVGLFPAAATPWNGLGRRPGQAVIIRMAGTAYSTNPWNSLHGGFNLAHEFGHNTGLRHILNPMSCGSVPGSADGTFDALPFGASPCTLGATDLNSTATAVGFDPLTWTLAPPAVNGDLMSYATSVWISEYNWLRLYAAYTQPPPPASGSVVLHAPGDGEPVLLVQGALDLEANTATLQPAYTLPDSLLTPAILAELTRLPDDLPADHPVRFQLIGEADVLLTEQTAPLGFHEDGDGRLALVSRVLPLLPGVREVRLVHGTAVLAHLLVSPHPPTVQLETPVLEGGHLRLAWTADDPDDEALLFTVQFSPDDGVTWQTLTVNLPEPVLAVAAGSLAGGAAVRFRVLATDGVHSAVATSEPFALPRHAPAMRMTGILEGQQFEFGALAGAQGFGYDAEDGSLSDAALRWTLDGPERRQAAGGSFSLANLAPGTYTLSLEGTDSDEQTGVETLGFAIRTLTVAEGAEPILDGLCADPAYSGTPPLQLPTTPGLPATVRLAHANGALFVCFIGLGYGSADGTGTIAGLAVNGVGAGPGLLLSAGFAVNAHGEPVRLGGEDSRLTVLTNPPPGFSAVILRDENTWSAEMRIEDELLGGWAGDLQLAALFDDGDAATPPQTWPSDADLDHPTSWAPGRPAPQPALELIVNGSFEDTGGGFVADSFGLMSLPPESRQIPGWTTVSAELAWVNNANTFGAATPFGTYALELTGYHDRAPFGGVSQTIPTVPGRVYRLSLALGSNTDYPGAGGQKQVTVSSDAASTTLTFDPPGDPGNEWHTVTTDFTASGAATPITITGLTANGIYLGLDNVSVVSQVAELRITSVELAAGILRLSFPGETGRRYTIQSRSALGIGRWEDEPGSSLAGAGGPLQASIPLIPGDPGRFYRVASAPE